MLEYSSVRWCIDSESLIQLNTTSVLAGLEPRFFLEYEAKFCVGHFAANKAPQLEMLFITRNVQLIGTTP